jgi:D-alanyl-D-alanine carboxypeptidase
MDQIRTTSRPARRAPARMLRVSLVLAVGFGLSAVQPMASADATTSEAAASRAADSSAAAGLAMLARLAQKAVDAGLPGVVVHVDAGPGHTVDLARQAGWSRADHRLAAADEFRMASNTKTFVATIGLQLVAEHRLALSDSVEKWLPGQIPNGRAITVRMLLNHTSGLYNYTEDPRVLADLNRRWTPTELLALATAHKPTFAPGTSWSYSNTGYLALGLVLEKVTGQCLADLLQQRIATPLHLRHTYLATALTPWRGRHASGYEKASTLGQIPPGVPVRHGFADGTDLGIAADAWAAGAVVSTAPEMARFQEALLGGRLLPAAQLRQMTTTVPVDKAFRAAGVQGYGLGLISYHTPCGTVWGHGGDVPGYASIDYTDRTGRRSAQILFSAHAFDQKSLSAQQALVTASVCAMLGVR